MTSEPSPCSPSGACARPSRPRTRRSGRCGAPTSTSARGEFVAIMGPSGCGKSTLLNLVAGLDQADEGTIVLAGEKITGRSEDELARMRRRHIGIVFQFFNLLEGMTVLENVALPAMVAGLEAPAGRDPGPRPARPARPRRQGHGSARRAVRRPAPAPRHRPGAGQRADAAAGRRAHRRPRLRGRPRGDRAVPPAARRRPDDPDGHPRRRRRRRRRAHRADARRARRGRHARRTDPDRWRCRRRPPDPSDHSEPDLVLSLRSEPTCPP